MSRNTKPTSFWDWLGPFVLIAAFITFLFVSTPSELVLCRADKNCFREWLSSLSGWAGAIATFATIAFLSKQIRAADRQHNDLLRLQLQPTLALSERVADTAKRFATSRGNVMSYVQAQPESQLGLKLAYQGASRELGKAVALISSIDFDAFEQQVGSGQPNLLPAIRDELKKVSNFGPGPHEEAVLHRAFDDRRDRIAHAVIDADNYCRNCALAAERYKSAWENLAR